MNATTNWYKSTTSPGEPLLLKVRITLKSHPHGLYISQRSVVSIPLIIGIVNILYIHIILLYIHIIDNRYRKTKQGKVIAEPYQPTESGCG